MTVDQSKINNLKDALNAKFENKNTNKKDNISGDFSSDTASYPTVKAVKNYVSTELQNKVDVEDGKGLSTNDFTTALKNKLDAIDAGATKITVDSSLKSDSENPVQNKVVKSALDLKANSADLKTVATSGSYNDLTDKPSLTDLGGVVTVEQQATAESGYTATYVVKQNGSQVGAKINVPKDFLVRSATVETVETANEPQTGFAKGDKYIDFVINTKDSSETAEHLYLLVTDLIDTYTADETTITLSGNQFAVKAGSIGTTQLTSAVNTSLGYADAYNSSAAKTITTTDISNWNAKSELTQSDIDTAIGEHIDALITALN